MAVSKKKITVKSQFGEGLFKPFYITDDVKIFCMEVPNVGVFLLSNGTLTLAPGSKIETTTDKGKVISRKLIPVR